MVLYNMISGKLPFEFSEEPNIVELHEKIIAGNFLMPKEACDSCKDLIGGI